MSESTQNFFNYPFDNVGLMKERRRIREQLMRLANKSLKIYILSGSTIGELKDLIELFLLSYGIKANIKVGDYNTYFEDAVFGTNIEKFGPDWIYIHTTVRNIQQFPKLSDSVDVLNGLISEEISKLNNIIVALEKHNCQIVVNNFEKPSLRRIGNMAVLHPCGVLSYINHLNSGIYDLIQDNSNLFLNDIEYLSSLVGLDKWHDWNFWNAFKYALSPETMPWIASSVASIVASSSGKSKKALICDLDNTLWGGIIGDDGVDKVELGPDTAKGEAFYEVQNYISDLKDRGIILAVNSKNDEKLARTGFTHTHSVLSDDAFAAFLANWSTKSVNMGDLANHLNLGHDSFVFIDDNPAEIAEIGMQYPEITSFSYKKTPVELIMQIDRLGVFEPVSLSAEDLKRSTYYQENLERELYKNTSTSVEDFLGSLQMTARIGRVDDNVLERSAQLVNKTNQFNPTTRRTTPEEVRQRMSSSKHFTLYGSLSDKFGDNGIVSVLLAEMDSDIIYIDTWVMSCRVFNREFEYAMFDTLIEHCKKENIKSIIAFFKPTSKNSYVADLYDKLGFDKIEEKESERQYIMSFDKNWKPLNRFIEVEHV